MQNAFYEKERDLYFTWCTDVLKAAQTRQNQNLLKAGYDLLEDDSVFVDDCLEGLFFETLLKLDYKSFTAAMLTCFWEYFLHVNSSYGQIETRALGEFTVHTHRLIGIEALWQIVLVSADEDVHKQATAML